MTFRVGMKVVCILNKPWTPQPGLIQMPFYQCVYTIVEVRCVGCDVGLRFHEIRNPAVLLDSGMVGEPCFHASQFRPIVERKTDISIFKRILNSVNQGVDA